MNAARLGIRAAQPCLACQRRAFTAGRSLSAQPTPPKEQHPPPKPPTDTGEPKGPLANVPRSYGKRHDDFTPMPLSRPIGMPSPPNPGENTGIDRRSLRQRREDFGNFEKHLAKRRELKNKLAKPYFRDWANIKWHKGKSFLAPPRLFKGPLSLYFPNLVGQTLLKDDRKPRDTTPLLRGRASVVAVFSGRWAETQAESFVSPAKNPGLQAALDGSGGRAQLVRLNVEESLLKAWLVRLFLGSLRRAVGRPNWDKYFLVRRGVSDEIRESVGLLNSKVGYVYLVDPDCRIRWAGSGSSEPEEREGLAKGVRRLLGEMDKAGVRPAGAEEV